MKEVKLTKFVTGKVVGESILVKTHQQVAGGGSRNLIVWALQASKLGYKTMLVEIDKAAPADVVNGIMKNIRYANELVNHLGLYVRRA